MRGWDRDPSSSAANNNASGDKALRDAEAGDLQAQLFVAFRADRVGDHEHAFRWYHRVLEQHGDRSSVDAMLSLATMYNAGLGCTVNVDQAVYWLQKTVGTADPDKDYRYALAAEDLGYLSLGLESHGRDLQGRTRRIDQPDVPAAANWLEATANADAAAGRGVKLESAEHLAKIVSNDLTKAIRWL